MLIKVVVRCKRCLGKLDQDELAVWCPKCRIAAFKRPDPNVVHTRAEREMLECH